MLARISARSIEIKGAFRTRTPEELQAERVHRAAELQRLVKSKAELSTEQIVHVEKWSRELACSAKYCSFEPPLNRLLLWADVIYYYLDLALDLGVGATTHLPW